MLIPVLPCQCRRHWRHGFDPWVGMISWMGRKWQHTPVFMPHVTVETVILLGMGPMEVSYMVFLLNHSTFPVVLASWRIPVQLAKTYEH